jgi:hypothetical protein
LRKGISFAMSVCPSVRLNGTIRFQPDSLNIF